MPEAGQRVRVERTQKASQTDIMTKKNKLTKNNRSCRRCNDLKRKCAMTKEETETKRRRPGAGKGKGKETKKRKRTEEDEDEEDKEDENEDDEYDVKKAER